MKIYLVKSELGNHLIHSDVLLGESDIRLILERSFKWFRGLIDSLNWYPEISEIEYQLLKKKNARPQSGKSATP